MFRLRGCHAAGGTLHWASRGAVRRLFLLIRRASRSPMTAALPDADLDQLFRSARTYNAFSGEISDDTLRQLYDLVQCGQPSPHMSPARVVLVKSTAATARLAHALSDGHHNPTKSAPGESI